MFISIVGTRASGKTSVEEYLVSAYHFRPVRLLSNWTQGGDKPRPNIPMGLTSNSSDDDLFPPECHGGKLYEISANATTLSNRKNLLPLFFETPDELLDYATRHWRESFVTCDLNTPQLIQQFIKRPFFLLLSIDAPLLTRYQRTVNQGAPNLSLGEFMEDHDTLVYGHQNFHPGGDAEASARTSLHHIFRLANIHVLNPFDTLSRLHAHLRELNLIDVERLRPHWDTYFMTLAALASQRSNCMKRRVGAILVRDKRIVATGYNGTPRHVRNCNEGGCRRCNSGGPSGEALDECLCLHAEENALLEAGRERVGAGAVLYCNTCPCLGCAIKIVQTGVTEVVYNLSYKVDDRTAALFNEAGVTFRQHSPPQ